MQLIRLVILFAVPLVVGRITAIARRRTVAETSAVTVTATWLLYVAVAVQLARLGDVPPGLGWLVEAGSSALGLVVAFVLVLAWLAVNMASRPCLQRALGLIVAGMLMNVAAMAANGGDMPYFAWAARVAGAADGADSGAAPIDHTTNLIPLCDVIPLPTIVISAGDLVIMAGVAMLAYRLTLGHPSGVAASPASPDLRRTTLRGRGSDW